MSIALGFTKPLVPVEAGSYLIPNPRMEMPSLLYPKRKPVGNVVIDWEHPLADKLTFLTTMDATDSNIHEKVSNNLYSSGGFATADIHHAHTSLGKCARFDGPKQGIRLPTNVLLLDENSTFTVQLTGGAGNASVFGGWGNSLYIQAQQGIQFRVRGPSNDSIFTAFTDFSSPVICSVTSDGVNNKLYVDGVLIQTIAGVASNLDMQYLFMYTGSDTYDFVGDIYYLSKSDRVLSDQEIKTLHDNPYQFLIPQ